MNKLIIDELLQRSVEEANRLNVAVTISIVDNGGHLVALLRQENCSYFTLESSRKKAITASQLKLPSHVLNEISKKFPELKHSLTQNTDVELLPGGYPIRLNGVIIGGIGIAGGNFDQDKFIGEQAIQNFE